MKISDDDADARRAIGVTTIATAPSFGIFNGQSVVLNLGDGTMASRVIRNPAAMQFSFNTRPTWTFPDSLMGVIAYIRQIYLDADLALKEQALARTNPVKGAPKRFRPDDELLAFLNQL